MLTIVLIISGLTLLTAVGLALYVFRFRNEASNRLAQLEQQIISLNRLPESQKTPDNQAGLFPLRVQAAERLIVLVERIKPGMLVHRHLTSAATAAQLAALMLQNIREEFEYNISQQLYVSERSWQLISAAREEIIQLIHLSLAAVEAEASPEMLARELFAASLRFPDEALASLRAELNTQK
ncbi:MAG: hypothetical protein IPM52_13030 [Bacteroidetes bacterium]|nr:hypothetical protein [Bacteroidota bacterium]